jgi:hypothetical protein
MPDRATQAMRRRLQRRGQLVRARSRAKNEIHAVLMRCLVGSAPFSDLFGQKGRRWLSELELPANERESVEAALRQIEFFDQEIEAVERLIATDALESPEIKRLTTVPGVNLICAATFMAAIGEIGRFESPRRLAGYLGLDPRVSQSGSGPAAHGPSRVRPPPATPRSRRAGRRSASRVRSTPSMREPAPAAGTRSRSSPRRASSRACSGACSREKRTTPTSAVIDRVEDAPACDPRRGAAASGHQHGDLGDEAEDARRGARARRPGRGRLQAHGRRLAAHPGEEGRRRDTGARI